MSGDFDDDKTPVPGEDADDSSVDEGSFADKTSIVGSDTFRWRLDRADREPASLVLLVGPAALIGKQFQLTSAELVIGRSMNSHIYIDDKSVSKAHAKVLVSGFEVSVVDLNSTNKTVINNHMVPPGVPVKLNNNDQIRLGNVIFKFLEEGSIEAVSAKDAYDRAQKDPLTQIHNKGALLGYGPDAYKRSELMSLSLGIVVFDIDHFKKINDTYGHAAGDEILRDLSQQVSQQVIRSEDFFARFGGEEFVIVLHATPLDQSLEICERLRKTIEQHTFSYQGTVIPVTISVGLSQKDSSVSTWDELFERADQALYASKKGGRNRVSHL